MSDEPTPYQPFYCEENAWHLCRQQGPESVVVFISNAARQVVVFSQRAATELPYVVWDYHVVVASPAAAGDWWVHDPDCTAGNPLPMERWLAVSFPHVGQADPRFDPRFGIVSGPSYVARFASDRRHMRHPGGWHAPPPPWPCIGEGFNLFDFVRMTDPSIETLDLTGLCRRFCSDRPN